MRQLVCTMFNNNNQASFQFWWKEILVKYWNRSPYYTFILVDDRVNTRVKTDPDWLLHAVFTLFTIFSCRIFEMVSNSLHLSANLILWSLWWVFEEFLRFNQVLFKQIDEFVIIAFICTCQASQWHMQCMFVIAFAKSF